MSLESLYIQALADHSETPQHELIVECLEECGVCGTRDLTLEQLQQFCNARGIFLSPASD